MIKKINMLLIFLLLLIVSLGAVSAADDLNETIAINEIDNGDNILTASEYDVTSATYGQYFSSSGELSSIVKSGDTLTLSGDFSGKDFIINKQITLQGNGGTISNGIVRLNSGASGSVIHDLKIRNTENFHQGIYLVGADNCEIYNNDIQNGGQSSYPIAIIEEANNNNIHDNTLKGYGASYGHGTRSVPIILVGRSNDNIIADNNIESGDANAIYLSSYNGGEFKGGESYNNIIRNNVINYMVNVTSWAYGIQLMGGNNSVDSNKIYGAYRGVSSSNFPFNKVINNIIYVSGTDFSSHAATGGDYGIAVAANATIRNNTVNGGFIGAAISGGDGSVIENNYVNATKGYGIEAPGDNIKVIENEIHSASAGVHQQGHCEGIVVDRNVIFSGSATGVLLSKSSKTKYPSDITIINNQITTSNPYIINAADADKDSWTIKNNTGTGQILTPDGEIDPSVPDFVFNGTTHYVTPANYHNFIDENGNLKNDFVHDGDILNFDGTFNDKEILVSSSVKITGKNPTFLNSTFIVTSDSVWIENLTIINKNASVHSAWGIYVADAQIVKLLNNDITVYDPTSAYAIYVYQSSKVYVEDNKLTSHGDSLTYTLLGYGAENCEFKNNIVNCIGTGELHAFENSRDINGNGSEVCIGQCIGHCLGDILKEHCLDGTNIVPELYRTYGILMIKSSNNTLTENDVSVTSLVDQPLAVNSTNSLVGIDFYYDCDNNIISNNKINVTGLDNYLYGAGALAHSTGQYAATTAINNTFMSNDIYISGPNVGEGLILGHDCDDTNLINNNIYLDCGRTVYGIVLEMSHDSAIAGNIITFESDVGYGIEVFESDNNVINNNMISGNGKIISGIAASKSSNNVIQNNTIMATGDGSSLDFIVRDILKAPNSGIYFEGASKGNLIDSNSIATNNGYPVDLSVASTGNTVTNNYLKGKEGSGDDGVNNSKGNTVHDNYGSTFNNIIFDDVTAAYASNVTFILEFINPEFRDYDGAIAQFKLGDAIIGNATVQNGVAKLPYQLNKNYNVGNYTITASLSKRNFQPTDVTANLEIVKSDIAVVVGNVTAKAGDTVSILARLTDPANNPISGMEVKFYRNAQYIKSGVSDKNGIVSVSVNIPKLTPGKYAIYANVAESENYNQGLGEATMEITDDRIYTQIEASDITMFYKDGTRLAATLKDADGKALSGLNITFTINGQPNVRTTDANGQASIALNLNPGQYNASVVFNGDSKYSQSNKDVSVNIKPTLVGNDIVMMYKNGTRYYVSVKQNDKPIANEKITFNINGVFYSRTTDANGLASLAINLLPKNYIITAVRDSNGETISNTIEVKSLLIDNKDIEMFYRNGSRYTVKVIKSDGTAAGAGEEVTFNINGVFYKRTTDANGVAGLNINLLPGDYIISAEYNGCVVGNNIKVKPVLIASDLVKKYGTSDPFEIKVLDGQGKGVAKANVGFNINGVFYNRVSDDNGIARLNINLMPGEYIITSTYGEALTSNKVTVNA
ncbi:right-handed parallel beta-helix repeat-containing protein [uncultured Methanobrevibacter sp.]|uniref:right-handed parallel beta-helix repeat-containing protein n=1 Tax=uncultured Methanobrevibacter sp. TaxID=253161 RepID=UPI0025F64C4B|nr:Ig-like domain repeat protein [uncultured Methanobrevibacter sp.]